MRITVFPLLLITLTGVTQTLHAACVRNAAVAGWDGIGMSGIGNINVTDNYVQPPGTIITSTVIEYAPSYSYPSPDTVVYTCDKTDIGQIYEIFATNGDDRVGGALTIGTEDGLTSYYQNYVQYTGIKLTHLNSGQPFERNWQQHPITSYLEDGDKIKIRAKDFSRIKVEIAKVSSQGYSTASGAASNYCGNGFASPGAYICTQPNGYVIFKGPGLGNNFPAVGSDSANNWQGWPAHWTSFGLGTQPRATVTKNATCLARNVTPTVLFPSISILDLRNGKEQQASFNITVECSAQVASGNGSGQTAIGIQVSEEAYNTAESLGFVNAKGGVSYLLSDGYGVDSSIAQGVGIALKAPNGISLPFVGWKSCNAGGTNTICPTGYDGGWYPILDQAKNTGSAPQAGYNYYTTQFTAILQKLPGIEVTPGRVYAKGYVLVRVQ